MVMTDPIADMLTRIRNANQMRHKTVLMTASTIKVNIAKILKSEGYIFDYSVDGEGKDKCLTITMKYGERSERVITGLKRISKPGLRVYATNNELPKVLNGLGIAIISTSLGIMTDRNARIKGTGGEVLAYVW